MSVCSLSFNETFDKQLRDADKGDSNLIERRLKSMAFEANIESPGLLDALNTHIQRMPNDLKEIRKYRIGRHRIYYTGHHSKCLYNSVLAKINNLSSR